MARISPTATIASPTDQLDAELGRLLERLQHSILYVDAGREKALRTSEIERTRAERNLAYARSVLTRLEQESVGLKAHLLRQDVQSNLNRKREALEVLMDRMRDLSKAEIEDMDDDATDSQDDILADIIPTPSESMDSRSADHSMDLGEQGDEPGPADPRLQTTNEKSIPSQKPPRIQAPAEPTSAPLQPTTTASNEPTSEQIPPPTTTSQTLRPRRHPEPHPSPRAALLRRKPSSTPQSTTAEALLDRQRVEQDTLVENILGYASALKDSSRRFHDTLEEDRTAMERAAEGMDRAGTGMEGAKRRMGFLERMVEGKGWWERVVLYAWVYGLMVVLVLLVFVLPKLRF